MFTDILITFLVWGVGFLQLLMNSVFSGFGKDAFVVNIAGQWFGRLSALFGSQIAGALLFVLGNWVFTVLALLTFVAVGAVVRFFFGLVSTVGRFFPQI